MSLLENAKNKVPPKNARWVDITSDEIELALAWARDEVTLSDASRAWLQKVNKKHGMNIYVTLARSLKEAIKQKLV